MPWGVRRGWWLLPIFLRNFRLNCIYTVVNDSYQHDKSLTLVKSAESMAWRVHVLKAGVDWHMWKKPMKLDLLLQRLPSQGFFVYCDAFDVKVRISFEELYATYRTNFEDRVVFNGEANRTVWLHKTPIDYKHHMIGTKPFAHLNAGVFFGRVWAVRKVVDTWVNTLLEYEEYYTAGKYGCDQAALLWAWSKDPELPITVDTQAKLCAASRGCRHNRLKTVPILHMNEGNNK